MNGQGREIIDFHGHLVWVLRRARRNRLGVSIHPNGQIKVSTNRGLPQTKILGFLESHKEWIEKSIDEIEKLKIKYPPKQLVTGEMYPYLGRNYRLRIISSQPLKIEFKEEEILFHIPEISEEVLSQERRMFYLQKFKKAYRQVAEGLMRQRLEFYSKKMELYPSALKFRGQKTIWGSCTPENKINLNFKLIVAPLRVIDYVVIHELAHIKHKNHSKTFWDLVEKYTEHRLFAKHWLKENQYLADFLGSSELSSEFLKP